MKRSRDLFSIMLSLVVFACATLLTHAQPNSKAERKQIGTENLIRFFSEVNVEEIQDHSFVLSFTTAEPASISVVLEDSGGRNAGLRTWVEEKKDKHQIVIKVIRALRPGETQVFSISAFTEAGLIYDYRDKFTVPQLRDRSVETRRYGTEIELFFTDLRITASADAVTFSFATAKPASLYVATRYIRPPTDPTKDQSDDVARVPRFPIPDFSGLNEPGVGKAQVPEKRTEHSVSVRPRIKFEPDKSYFYLIVATTEEGRTHRYVGKFTRAKSTGSNPSAVEIKRRQVP